jgi:hypothetical protein
MTALKLNSFSQNEEHFFFQKIEKMQKKKKKILTKKWSIRSCFNGRLENGS